MYQCSVCRHNMHGSVHTLTKQPVERVWYREAVWVVHAAKSPLERGARPAPAHATAPAEIG